MSIIDTKYVEDMRTYSSTSIFQRTINVCSLKTQRVVWMMMGIEEWSTRIWPRWTIHWRRESGRLGIEVPDVMEKRQVDVWVRDINHAMKSHKALSVNIFWIKKSRRYGQKETSWLYKSKKYVVSGSRQSCSIQYHVEALKLRQRWKIAQRRIKLSSTNLFLCVLFISWV
jgi:hypothetical protein